MPADNQPSGFFGGGSGKGKEYVSPFYDISSQFIPNSVDGMLWWMDFLLMHNGFLRSALSRIVSYFINTLVIECADEELKKKYMEAFEVLKYKIILQTSGLNLLAYSNECLTVTQGFDRFLKCNSCGNAVNIEKTNKYEFNKGKYGYRCDSCKSTNTELSDQPSRDVSKLAVRHWPMRELITRHDCISDQTDYYWNIPQSYVKNVSKKNNKFFSKVTPKYIMDCIFAQGGPKLLRLNKSNLIHLKIPHPSSIETDGKAIPLGMFMFSDFFNYATLKRFNEVICMEDINPFRLFSMTDGSQGNGSMFNQNGALWRSAITRMVEEHRRDPASYQTFPYPVNYQQLGGQGKQLVPVELMQQYKADILGAYNIPHELYEMNFQVGNMASPILRLFENAWSTVPESLNSVLQHMADVISKIMSWEKVKVSMLAVTISDDIARQSMIEDLVKSNVISKSTLLDIVNLNYEDQVKKRLEEDKITQKLTTEEQEKAQLEQAADSNVFNQAQPGAQGSPYDTSGSTPGDVESQAQDIAKKLFPMDGSQRRQELQQIKGVNQTLYSSVKAKLDEMTSQAKSQGVQGAKQQSAQSPQQ